MRDYEIFLLNLSQFKVKFWPQQNSNSIFFQPKNQDTKLCVSPEVTTIRNIRHSASDNEAQMDDNLINKEAHFNMTKTTNASSFFFESTTNASEVFSGETAFLICSVMNLGKNVVSWLRHSDMNLLSVGKLKYTQDPRYQVFHNKENGSWTLKVLTYEGEK